MPSCPGPAGSLFPRWAQRPWRRGQRGWPTGVTPHTGLVSAQAPLAGGLAVASLGFYSLLFVFSLYRSMHYFSNQGRKENNKVVVFILFLIKWFSSAKNPHQPAGNRAMQGGAWTCLISQEATVKSLCFRMTAAQTCSGETPAAFHPQHRDAASCPFPQPPTAIPRQRGPGPSR